MNTSDTHLATAIELGVDQPSAPKKPAVSTVATSAKTKKRGRVAKPKTVAAPIALRRCRMHIKRRSLGMVRAVRAIRLDRYAKQLEFQCEMERQTMAESDLVKKAIIMDLQSLSKVTQLQTS